MKIQFFSLNDDPTLPKPIPASRNVPDWYRQTPRYIGGEKGVSKDTGLPLSSVKTCMPFLDAMTAGYLILSSADVYISKEEHGRFYSWAAHDLISFHNSAQVSGFPNYAETYGTEGVPKFQNPWIVRTPNGYSSLFITPNNHALPFRIFAGVVETDTYGNSVNFPFLIDPDFEGLIKRGTPIAQVIPFKRESWKMDTGYVKNSDELQKQVIASGFNFATQFFDKYKRLVWQPKEYK